MGVLLIINRGPVDEFIEKAFDRIFASHMEYSEWQDFPWECLPDNVTRPMLNLLSKKIIAGIHQHPEIDCPNIKIIGDYIRNQFMFIDIKLDFLTYVNCTPTRIELTLEINRWPH